MPWLKQRRFVRGMPSIGHLTHIEIAMTERSARDLVSRSPEILADHWNTLPRLAAITKKDPAFRGFVMRHIDATIDLKDVEKIGEKASRECPTGLRSLCDEILKEADAARTEIDQPPHS